MFDAIKYADSLLGSGPVANLINFESLRPFVTLLGLLAVISFFRNILSVVWKFFLRPGKNMKKYGDWAVVTGSTDGIGEAMAIELAKKGLNIISISRNSEKFEWTREKDPATGKSRDVKGKSLGFGLKLTEDKIKEKAPKADVISVNVDFKQFDEAARNRVSEALKGKKIGVLINNVGESYDYCTWFHEISNKKVQDLLTMNIDSVVWMTRIVLQNMIVENGKDGRGKGAIVNIGSGSSVILSPLLAQYVGAKGFVEKFSNVMHHEYKGKGIDIQCQAPLMVATKLSKVRPSFFIPDPKVYARSAIKAIGYEAVTSPFWGHALQMWALNSLPDWIHAKVVMNMHLGVKKAAERKAKDSQ